MQTYNISPLLTTVAIGHLIDFIRKNPNLDGGTFADLELTEGKLYESNERTLVFGTQDPNALGDFLDGFGPQYLPRLGFGFWRDDKGTIWLDQVLLIPESKACGANVQLLKENELEFAILNPNGSVTCYPNTINNRYALESRYWDGLTQ